MALFSGPQNAKINIRITINKLTLRAKVQSEKDCVGRFKEKADAIWYDLNLEEFVRSANFALGFDNIQGENGASQTSSQ